MKIEDEGTAGRHYAPYGEQGQDYAHPPVRDWMRNPVRNTVIVVVLVLAALYVAESVECSWTPGCTPLPVGWVTW